MADFDNIYKTICRLCLSRKGDEKMVCLFDNRADDGLSYFGKAIATLTNILLQRDDNLPNMMCEKCAYLLIKSVSFKLKCETTNAKLQSLVQSDVKSEVSDRSIKEKVWGYVTFSNFPLDPTQAPSTSKNYRENGVKQENSNPVTSQIEIEITRMTTPTSEQACNFDGFLKNGNNGEDFDSKKKIKEENLGDDDNSDTIQDDNMSDDNVSDSMQDDNISDTIQDVVNKDCNTTSDETQRATQNGDADDPPPASSNEQNLICNVCNRKLANRLTYAKHIQRHSICRFVCEQCGKSFPEKSELHVHQIARHGIGPGIKCDLCPYKAPRKLELVEHMRLHTGERPFTCEKCGLTFRRKAIYRRHLKFHMEKTVPCKFCPMKFFEQSQMLAHCNNVHERLYLFICNICNTTYAKRETVRKHMIAKHGIPRDKQGKITRIGNNDANQVSNEMN